jgi:hypothetical protein
MSIDKGEITSYREYAFDYVNQGVRRVNEKELEWTSSTGGDPDGVILELDAPRDAVISFQSKPVSFQFKPAEITAEPYVVDVGPVNQRVIVQAITKKLTPKNLSFDTVVDLVDGLNPIWVKVTQEDGSMAWSSPVYINRK